MGLVIWQEVMHTIILSRSSFAFWSCLLIINWFRQEWWTLTCDDEQLLSSAFRYCMDYKIIISHRRCKNFLFVCLGYWYSSAVKGKQKTNKKTDRETTKQLTVTLVICCHIGPEREKQIDELREEVHMYLIKSCLRMNFSLTTFHQMVTHLYNSYGNWQLLYSWSKTLYSWNFLLLQRKTRVKAWKLNSFNSLFYWVYHKFTLSPFCNLSCPYLSLNQLVIPYPFIWPKPLHGASLRHSYLLKS